MSDFPNYDAVLAAINNSSATMENKYESIGKAAATLCDVNNVVENIPNASVVRDNDGDVIGYDYKYTAPHDPEIHLMEVDSNTDHGYYGGDGTDETSKRLTSPYAGGINPLSQIYMKYEQFVSGLVSTTWAGVSALGKFGKQVASEAADKIEEYGIGFEAEYGGMTVTIPGEGAAKAIRALFGIDSQGNTTMYLEDNVIGALAIKAKDEGFFDPPNDYIDDYSDETGISQNTLNFLRHNFPSGVILTSIERLTTYGRRITSKAVYNSYRGLLFSRPIECLAYITREVRDTTINYYIYVYAADTETFQYKNIQSGDTLEQLDANIAAARWYDATRTTLNGVTYYYVDNPFSTQIGNEVVYTTPDLSGLIIPYDTTYVPTSRELCYLMVTRAQPGSAIPGITDQAVFTDMSGAVDSDDPGDVADNLYNQYPTVMGSPINIVTMDDACNQVNHRYFSVPLSYSPTNLNIAAPITGGLQVNPSFNPDVELDLPDLNMDNYIDQLIKILGGSGAGRDVTNEPEPDDPDTPSTEIPGGGLPAIIPDTGEGETPPAEDPVVAIESMWHVYHCMPGQLNALGQWLWSANILDQIIRMFQNPLEAIMGVHALYIQPSIGSQVPIVVGNLTSTANAFVVTSQYKALDCGTVWLTEYFGNVFDYDPFTEVSLYLPFVGVVKLDTADVMRSKITVTYGVDCYTGACLAKVSVERDGAGGVLYEFPGNCAVEYPVSGASYSRMIQSIMAAGMSAVAVGMHTGGAPGSQYLGAAAAGASLLGGGEKIAIQRAGSLSGNAGVMGSKIPYLIVSRPQPGTAESFFHYQGFPSNTTVKVSELTGFQRFEEVHLKCPFAYKEELDEIESLLKSGVII